MAEVTTDILINAPMESVYAIITDFARYPEYIPDVTDIVVHRRSKTKARATLSINVIKQLHYTLQFSMKPPYQVCWELLEGEGLKKNSGEWWLQEEGTGTRVIYTIDLEFNFFIPDMIKRGLIEASLPQMLSRIQAAAEELHAAQL